MLGVRSCVGGLFVFAHPIRSRARRARRHQRPRHSLHSSRTLLLATFLLALLIRGGVAFSSLHRLNADPDAYRSIGETLASTGVYGIAGTDGDARPTAFRPPLYPYVLSWMAKDGQLPSISVALLHVMLGALTVMLTFLTGRNVFPDRRNAVACCFASAVLVAIDPILLQQSTLIMTETLAAALVSIIGWWWVSRCVVPWTKSSLFVLGILLALAYLCRPTFLVWALLLLGVVLFRRSESWTISIGRTVVVAIPLVTAVLGWTIRNQNNLGHPILATTHGGYTLLLANNPLFYSHLQSGNAGSVWDAEPFLVAYSHRYDGDPNAESFWNHDWQRTKTPVPVESEYADDRVSYDAAIATIRRQKNVFLWSCFVRLGRLWSPLPHHRPDRSRGAVYAVAAYYVVLSISLFVGVFRLYQSSTVAFWWPTITLVIALSAVHAIYWSNLRMRAPAVPLLAIVAASAFLAKPISGESHTRVEQ